jgi:hypothetical protein
MDASLGTYPTWKIFLIVIACHITITVLGLAFDWKYIENAAFLPVAILHGLGIDVLVCFTGSACVPDATALLLCLVIWIAMDYLVAVLWTVARQSSPHP